MIEPQKNLAVIPARGGSKGIPQKNIRILAGKPLIAWTIEAAKQALCVDRVVVSTDDQQIADIARAWGAEVPFMRPAELAKDDTPGICPLIHAVRWLEENEGYYPKYVMLLQATSPLRTSGDIDQAYELAVEKKADGVVSVCEAQRHPYWMKRIAPDGLIAPFMENTPHSIRRQDLPTAYGLNGAIYLVTREVLLAKETFFTDQTYGYIMPPERSLDIDNMWEFQLTELVIKHLHYDKSS